MSQDDLDLIEADQIAEAYENLGGRPPDYRPEFCKLLIRHMAQGFSFESFGSQVLCCEKTLYNWAKAYPEFLQAKTVGTILGLQWFEKRGKRGMGEQFFKPATWGIMLRNRFRKIGELSYDQKPGVEGVGEESADGFDTEDDDE